MAMPTRESSGLLCKVDAKGRMSQHMDGKRIQGVVNLQADTKGMERGTMTLTILTQFVTFDQVPEEADSRTGELHAIGNCDDPTGDPITDAFMNGDGKPWNGGLLG
jgi:hypothetical protein